MSLRRADDFSRGVLLRERECVCVCVCEFVCVCVFKCKNNRLLHLQWKICTRGSGKKILRLVSL
jgi:hypothetical protein